MSLMFIVVVSVPSGNSRNRHAASSSDASVTIIFNVQLDDISYRGQPLATYSNELLLLSLCMFDWRFSPE